MASSSSAMLAAGDGFADPVVTPGGALGRSGAVHQEPKAVGIAGATGTGKTKTHIAPPAPPHAGRAGKIIQQVDGGAMMIALTSAIGRTVGREIVRGLFGRLRAKPSRSTSRRSRW